MTGAAVVAPAYSAQEMLARRQVMQMMAELRAI
jgi:hypothetical protein